MHYHKRVSFRTVISSWFFSVFNLSIYLFIFLVCRFKQVESPSLNKMLLRQNTLHYNCCSMIQYVDCELYKLRENIWLGKIISKCHGLIY